MTFLVSNPDNETDGGTLELDGASSIVSADVGGFTYVFVAGGVDDGISVFRLLANGTLTPVHDVTDDATLELDGARGLSTAMVDGNTYLFVAGQADNGVSVFRVGTNGSLTNVANVTDDATMLLTGVSDTATARVGTSTYLYTAGTTENGISIFRVNGDGRLTYLSNHVDALALELAGVRAMTTVTIGATAFLIAGGTDDGISVFSINASTGALTGTDDENDTGSINLNDVSDITTAVIGGVTYVFVAGAADNGVSVYSLSGAGLLTHLESESDSATSLIAGANSVTVTVLGGITYLHVGGTESGTSLYQFIPTETAGRILQHVDPIADSGSRELSGTTTTGTASVGGTTYLLAAGATDDGVSTFGTQTTGQLWYSTEGNLADARIAFVNTDGGNHVTFLDNNPATVLTTAFVESVAIDSAAGLYYILVGGNEGINSRLLMGHIGSAAAPTVVFTFDPTYAGVENNLAFGIEIDTINERLYIGFITFTPFTDAGAGIRQFNYNVTTGAVTGGTFFVTETTAQTPPSTAGADGLFASRDLDIDTTHNVLYSHHLAFGDGFETNTILRFSLSSPGAATPLFPQAQFAMNGNGSDFTTVNGIIGDIEVDEDSDRLYFVSRAEDVEENTSEDSLWVVFNASTANGTVNATEVTLIGITAANFYPTDMILDEVNNILYIETENSNLVGGGITDAIMAFQLNAAGTTATLINTIDVGFGATANIEGLHYNYIAALNGISGTATPASEQGASLVLLTGAPTVTDFDGDHLASATVQITGGTFNSNENSFDDDDLGVGAGMAQSGTIAGTNITIAWNQATGTLTLTGYDTFANYQAALATVRYQSTGNNPTNYGLNPSRTITWTVSDGLPGIPGGQVNSQTTTLNITAVNDGPTNTVPGAQVVNEDSPLNLAISIADPDLNPAITDIVVTLTATNGTLTLLTNVALGLTAADIAGNGTGLVTITATRNEINTTLAALGGLVFLNTADYNGPASVQIVTNDGGNTGNDPGISGTGTTEQDSDTINITVNAVVDIANDAPSFAEDSGGGAQTIDVLANDSFENAARFISGVTQGTHGIVTIVDGPDADGIMDYVVYTQVADYNGTDSFTYTVTSGGVTETATVNVTITAVVDIAADTLNINEDAGTTTVDVLGNDSFENAARFISGVTQGLHGTVVIIDGPDADGIMDYVTYTPVADYNGADSFSYTVTSGGVTETTTVTVNLAAVADIVADSITVVEDSGANNLTLLANDNFENAGRAITTVGPALHGTTSIHNNGTAGDATDDFVVYTPTGNYFGPDSFTYTVTSGGVTETASVTVDVTAVNDPPLNTVPGTLNLSEDAVNIPVAGLQVSDPEAGPAGQPLTVTLSVARGTITISTAIVGGIDATHVSGGAPGASNQTSITITATQAQINATLAGANGLTYTPTANVNGNDTLTIVTSDLGYIGTGGILTDTDMRTLNVGAVNDAPTVGDGTESATGINEDTPHTSGSAQTVAGLFGPQFSDATDQVAGGSIANGLLGIAIVANGSNADGTWEWLNGGVWTAIGAATQAAAKTFTAGTQIRFNPATDFNGTAPTLTAHLVDNSSGSITNGSTVNLSGVGATGGTTRYSTGTVVLSQEVNAVNDGPANTVPGPLTINEDATNVAVTGIQVADVEAGPASQPLTVTLTVAHGTLHVDTTNGAGVGAGQVTGNDSASVTITGTQAQINATLAGLNGLTYTPTAHFNGADSLQIVTSDAGFTGTGGTLMDSDAVTINITAINDAPTVSGDGTEDAAAIPQDTPSATGQTVSSLFSPQYSDAADNQVPNGGASSPGAFGGIAVVANGSSPAAGQWQYLDGATWTDIGPATTAAAQLFDAGTFIRFNPAAGFTGAAPTLTVHLIDNSLGAFNDGDDANLTGATGGTTPYSTGQVVLSQQVNATNIAPVVDLNDGTPGVDDTNIFAEGTSGSGLGTSIAVSDADAGDMIEGATITLTDPAAGDELIANLPLPGGIMISGASTATTIILTGSTTADNYELALGQLGYRNTGNDPTLGGTDTSRSVTVTVTDGTANSAPATMTITVFGENDEPTLSATGDNPTFTEGGAAVDLFDPVSASTVEAGQTFASMTLTVTNVTDGANEILSFDGSDVALTNGNSVVGTTTNGLTVNVTVAGSTATVTFSGAALNAASLQTLVDAMTYRNTSQNPTDADRAVTITELVDSGSNTSPNDNTAALTILSTVNVNPVNDAASITGTASGDVTEAGGTDNTTAGTPTASADLDSTDIDNPNDTWQPVLAGTPSIGGYGTYAVNASGVWTYTLDDNDPAVQALFGAATLSDTFNVTTADGTAQLVTITIHAKDDFPTALPDTVTTDEGTILNGNVLDNNGSGPDSDPDSGITVSEVEGQPAGSVIVLDSGAEVTVNTDGTFTYDPNGMFDETPTPGSGATNMPAVDTFDYTLTNGNTVTVTVQITGLDTNDVLIGSAGDDVLDAGVGNDILVGLAGADEMIGGMGDDQYYVDDGGDLVVEQSGGGFDIVYAGANFALQDGEDVEILSAISLGDTAPLHLSGNDLDQEILGNAGANVIRGGGGTDVLAGQGGDDEYYVTEGNERIIEVAGGGRDVVYASTSYALTPGTTQVEILSALSLAGTDPLSLTGNEFVQQILGNNGDNVLRGGGGADALVGYGGDDDYYVTDGGETIHEAAGEGTDVVYASVDYVLRDGAAVEVLSTVALGGTDAIDLTGNDFANTLLGNAGDNVLNGGLGADTLVGFGGADTFSFTTSLGSGNVDFILDFVSGTDTIELAASLFAGLAAGQPLGTAFALGSAQDGGVRIIYDQASGGLYYDADGNGDGAAVQFATLNAGTMLTANDFSVI